MNKDTFTMPPTNNPSVPADSGQAAVNTDAQKAAAERQAATDVIRGQIDAIFNGDSPAASPGNNRHKPGHAQPVTAIAVTPQVARSREVSPVPMPLAGQTAPAAPAATTQPQPSNPYHRSHTPTHDWQQYHTAWQSYYQQYYQRYYAGQLQAATAAANPGPDSPPARVIKNDLLAAVQTRAHKFRKSSHFFPLLSGVLVVALLMFLQYNRVLIANIKAYVSPGSAISQSDTILVDPAATSKVDSAPRLIIPKINVNVPVVYDEPSMDNHAIQKALQRGVVRYNLAGANALPGQTGNLVIGGHSSNDVFDTGGYKFAFVLLDRLETGDIFYVHYQGTRYIYRVSGKQVILPTELSALQHGTDKPVATLVTCTPTGTAAKRLLVTAEQISPDPLASPAPPAPAQATTVKLDNLPGNSPTLLRRLADLF